MRNWETVTGRFVGNERVIGVDLRNEVRGFWGTMRWSSWAAAAEKAGDRLLEMNPAWLVIVEGTSSGNDLTSVKNRPVVLKIADRVVYSAHVYSWSGWGSLEGSYNKRSYESFAAAMYESWGYLVEEDIAPVWVGEFGAPNSVGKGDKRYWDHLVRYLSEINVGFGYWALNPRKPHGHEEESYGLVGDDWVTPIKDYRLRDMIGIVNRWE